MENSIIYNELINAHKELALQYQEKEKRAAELILANKELAFQNKEKENRASELIIANKELMFQNEEKEKRAAELIIANKELAFQNEQKEKQAVKLIIVNMELEFQNLEKGKRAAELLIANKELAFQNEEKEKRAAELILANKELSFQNKEKEKRAAELIVTNTDLKKAKEKFRLVVESSHNAMVLVNSEGNITLINKQTEKLFGYKRNELVNHKLEMIIPERFRKHYLDHRHEFLTRPLAHDMGAGREVFVLAKENREIQVEVVINPIETAAGHKVLLTIIDVTERKFHEALLKKQNQELEQFAYIASHDLQEPLRTISNYMMLFEEEYSHILDENAIKYLHSVKNTSMRMGAMIKSLLDFSRLNNINKLTAVDLNILVGDVLADLDTTIKTSNAVIKVSELPILNIYESEVRQLFQNIISNSIKFHKKDLSPEISISSEKINEKWKFAVTDNGIGIAPDYFERVFEIFKCLHTDEKYSGNGIGLAKCRKIVQLHQGEIWIESTPGKGTTIYFTIPILTI